MRIRVNVETLKTVFDALSTSMDFGSGFLDTHEVVALRDLADQLGLDPILATPSSHIENFYPDAPKDYSERWN